MKLQDLTLKQFLEKTAANEAVPGGGSSAALSAAIATALTEMVANLTIGKKKYVAVEERMKQIATEMSANRTYLVDDIDRDADAYRLLMDAYRLPKETEAEIALRDEKIEEATKIASLVPMEVAERAYNLLEPMMETLETGNRNAVTDGLVGLMTCRTAIMGALLNVRTNLGGIRDKAFVAEMTEKCDRMEKETLEKENRSIQWVKTML
ncbi:MAG: cyclodeaminase/cyclohydrolase family protein [Porphyromonadaceae bacterium]|nr:cyclodeaminase/cyclohydrolase family protein [Porphyromonadaceae bacterium]